MAEQQQSVSCDVFMSEWMEVLAVTVCVDLDLVGEGLVANFLSDVLQHRAVLVDKLIVGLDARLLPVEPNARIAELFKVQPRWRKEQLEELIRPVVPPGIKPEVLLLKEYRLDVEENNCLFYASKF